MKQVHEAEPVMSQNLPKTDLVNKKQSDIAWDRLAGLIGMHLGCLGVFWVSNSMTCVVAAITMYVMRAFALTAFYHRYFSHRAFKTSRWLQFGGALLGALALQKGPLWWAAHHRHHHNKSDQEGDVHSPHVQNFLWSHVGWIVARDNGDVREELVRDWLRFPELEWLERNALLIGLAFGGLVFGLGEVLLFFVPRLNTSGPALLVWVFFVSTVALYHATYAVNSIAHLFGSRPFATGDGSRNNWIVALLTLGEGWRNNHHRYQSSARQGFLWWQIDLTFYALWLMARVGLVWDVRPVPNHILATAQAE